MPRLRAADEARVSVVIPVHNAAEFIGDAVRSALGQTRPPYECVVVDDGSTDGTADVLESFGDDITVISQVRSGVAAARNAGIRASQGDLIALLDADDVWLPHKLLRQVTALADHPGNGAVCSGYVLSNRALVGRRTVSVPDGPMDVRRSVLLQGPGVGFSFTGLVTRTAIETVGPFDERFSTTSDLEFAWRLARRTGLIGVSEPLALYRRHGGGQMHHDLDRLEHDMTLLLSDARDADLSASNIRRGRANLETYLGFRRLFAGQLSPASAHLIAAVRHDPRRVVVQPANAFGRRLHQWVSGRRLRAPAWPAGPAVPELAAVA